MEQTKPPDLLVDALFTADSVSADRRNLHVMKPFHKLAAVLESRFIVIGVGREQGLRALFIIAVEPSSVQHQYIVLFYRYPLLFGGVLQIVESHTLAPVEMLLAFIKGGIDQEAAPDHSMLGDGLN